MKIAPDSTHRTSVPVAQERIQMKVKLSKWREVGKGDSSDKKWKLSRKSSEPWALLPLLLLLSEIPNFLVFWLFLFPSISLLFIYFLSGRRHQRWSTLCELDPSLFFLSSHLLWHSKSLVSFRSEVREKQEMPESPPFFTPYTKQSPQLQPPIHFKSLFHQSS